MLVAIIFFTSSGCSGLSGCWLLFPSLASLSAVSFPSICVWDGIHCRAVSLLFLLRFVRTVLSDSVRFVVVGPEEQSWRQSARQSDCSVCEDGLVG